MDEIDGQHHTGEAVQSSLNGKQPNRGGWLLCRPALILRLKNLVIIKGTDKRGGQGSRACS